MVAFAVETPRLSVVDRPRSASPAPPRAGWVTALVPAFVAMEWEPPRIHVDQLPLPPICAPFFRDGEEGEKQYRLAVGAATVQVRGLAVALAELAEREGLTSDAFGRRVLLVLPKERCARCGRVFITGATANFCSDRCRRLATAAGEPAGRRQRRRQLRPDCAHCHGPLHEPETLFCSTGCFRAAERERWPADEERERCMRCDRPLTRMQRRYCGIACKEADKRDWLDGLVTA